MIHQTPHAAPQIGWIVNFGVTISCNQVINWGSLKKWPLISALQLVELTVTHELAPPGRVVESLVSELPLVEFINWGSLTKLFTDWFIKQQGLSSIT